MQEDFTYLEDTQNNFFEKLKKDKLAFYSFIFILAIIFITLLGFIIYPGNELGLDLENTDSFPSLYHPLGTDLVGRDVLGKLICATKLSVFISSTAVFVQILIGSVLGVISGYYGGVIDKIIMKIVDVLMSMPFLPFFIMFNDILYDARLQPENKIYIIMFVVGLLSWPGTCRLVRGQILSLKNREFMEAAEALGIKRSRKMFVHLIPNTFPSILVVATLGFGNAILIESSLSFLGLGVPTSSYSWGNIIRAASDLGQFQTQTTSWASSAVLIFLTVMSINLFGDWLKEALNPKSPVHVEFKISNLFKKLIIPKAKKAEVQQ